MIRGGGRCVSGIVRHTTTSHGKRLMTSSTTTASVEAYESLIRDAVRLPVPGLIKSYRAVQYDDFGNSFAVLIRSTEHVSENGEVTWKEAIIKQGGK